MEIKGRITKKLEVETGTSKAGKSWQKQSFVVDTGAEYNPEVCFQESTMESITITLMLGR